MSARHLFEGGCHCDNLTVVFETEAPPGRLAVRACACSFCRRHGARTVTDPAGRVRIGVADPALLARYRFGLGTADFLLCRRCGVYLGAVHAEGDRSWATINVNTFHSTAGLGEATEPVSYDGESADERRARRRARWTPVIELVEGAAGAP